MASSKKNAEKPDKTDKSGKNKTLQTLMGQWNKKHGVNTVIYASSEEFTQVARLPTGIAQLDGILGGGLPRGRFIELFGNEGSGKTTTTLQIIKNAQEFYLEDKQRTAVTAFIDAEHALDPAWAASVGVKMDELLMTQPDSGNAALELMDDMIKSGEVDLIVIDSLAALAPQEELDGEMADQQIGAQARMISKALRKTKAEVNNNNVTIIFINQIRNKVGVKFGSPETTPGGMALKFYASVRMDVRRGAPIRLSDTNVGAEVVVKTVKNKVARPYQRCVYSLYFGEPAIKGGEPIYGVDLIGGLFDSASSADVIVSKGSWYYFGEDKLGLGREASLVALRTDAKLRESITKALHESIAASKSLAASSDNDLAEAFEDDEG